MGLSARDLSFAYPGGPTILDSWSMDFPASSMTAIRGPSGRGKSTLLYLLGLMLTPDAGDVLLGGEPVAHLPDRARSRLRAERFGFVFQDAQLDLTRSVLDNVCETAVYRGESPATWHERADRLLGRFEVGVDPRRRPSQVSGGQAQRISLSRALIGSPTVVLGDEPTGNLDPHSGLLVVQGLREYARSGGTVVIVTHSPEVAVACDHVVDL